MRTVTKIRKVTLGSNAEIASIDINSLMTKNAMIYDIKTVLPKDKIDARLYNFQINFLKVIIQSTRQKPS